MSASPESAATSLCSGGHRVVQCPCHVRLRIRMALYIGLDFSASTSKTNRRDRGEQEERI